MYSLKDVEEAYSHSSFSLIPQFLGKNLRKKAIYSLHIKDGDNVLDIACGKGENFPLIKKKIGNAGKIIAIDYSKTMLNLARKKVKNKTNITLIRADAAKIKYKAKFDAIISVLGFSSIPDHKEALKKAVGALKKGRKLVILDGKKFDFKPLNLLMPILRWNKSYDKNKDLIKDIITIFPQKKIIVKEYNLGSNFILELTN